jgi:hypothetical protein
VGRGILGVLIADPRPLRLHDIADDPRSAGFPPNHPPMRSFLGGPVTARGRVYGKRLEAVREVTTAILAGTDTGELLGLVVGHARQLVDADLATLALPAGDDRLVIEAADGFLAADLRGTTFPAEGSVTGEVLRTGKAAALADAASDDRTTQPIVAAGLGPALVIPWRCAAGAGEMWNSNSVIAWLLARSGLPIDVIRPPAGGRAPGWQAGVAAAHRPPGTIGPPPLPAAPAAQGPLMRSSFQGHDRTPAQAACRYALDGQDLFSTVALHGAPVRPLDLRLPPAWARPCGRLRPCNRRRAAHSRPAARPHAAGRYEMFLRPCSTLSRSSTGGRSASATVACGRYSTTTPWRAMSPTITRVTPSSRSSRAEISATDTTSLHNPAMERCSRPSPASCSSMPVTVCTSASSSRSSWAGRVRPPVTV